MSKKELYSTFAAPGAEWRGKPFWSWNGELREEELVRQVKVMKEMGLGGYFMHSRAGLITEYLGDEWFDLINAVADAGEKEGMEAWLYDEDRWPSGSAGGKVTIDPQYRMKALYVFESAAEHIGAAVAQEHQRSGAAECVVERQEYHYHVVFVYRFYLAHRSYA